MTYEESRLDTPGRVPQTLVKAAGLTPYGDALDAATTVADARERLAEAGARLWRTAAARAKPGPEQKIDDRPLYWARLIGTRAIRQWSPAFPVSDDQRADLLRAYEYASRGIRTGGFRPGVVRVLVSGFDPYRLGEEIRRSNPSGAAALRLDDVTWACGDSGNRTVQVRTVVLPVTWGGFDAGIVEDAFGPHLTAGVDLIMTVSQGDRGVMAIERWAGAWRGGSPDNEDVRATGPIPPAQGPEFIETTLPHATMIGAGTTPWPVVLRETIREHDPVTGIDRTHDDGPTPGARARAGGGGNYLSNESMYRSNRLRRRLGATGVPGGHLHVSALVGPDDPAFEADRAATVEQTVALVEAAVSALR